MHKPVLYCNCLYCIVLFSVQLSTLGVQICHVVRADVWSVEFSVNLFAMYFISNNTNTIVFSKKIQLVDYSLTSITGWQCVLPYHFMVVSARLFHFSSTPPRSTLYESVPYRIQWWMVGHCHNSFAGLVGRFVTPSYHFYSFRLVFFCDKWRRSMYHPVQLTCSRHLPTWECMDWRKKRWGPPVSR